MARIAIYEGYGSPFGAASKRKKRRSSSKRRRSMGGLKKQQNKMKVCARKWKSYKGGKKYISFMRECL